MEKVYYSYLFDYDIAEDLYPFSANTHCPGIKAAYRFSISKVILMPQSFFFPDFFLFIVLFFSLPFVLYFYF